KDDAGPTEMEHPFEILGAPPAMICFVDDGGNPLTPYAKRLETLQVSYFVTSNQLPAGWLQASTDRRNFKIEVVDTGAKGDTIKAEVEAKKPVLDAKGKPKMDAAGEIEFESFNPPRKMDVELKKVPKAPHLFRSRYLRL